MDHANTIIWTASTCLCTFGKRPGGWAITYLRDGQVQVASGRNPKTDYDVMGLTAAIRALEQLTPGIQATVVASSEEIVMGATTWCPAWRKRRWRRANGSAIRNVRLWMRLDELLQERPVHFEWSKDHEVDPGGALARETAHREALAAAEETGWVMPPYPEANSSPAVTARINAGRRRRW